MCAGLPSYSAVADLLPGASGPVGFATDAADPAGAERFFCAQYQLAPTVLQRWRPGALDPPRRWLPGSAAILQIDEPSARAAFLAELSGRAERQGAEVEHLELPGGLSLVRATAR
jgi:hypothetical protein